MRIGIIGPPQSGKTALFTATTGVHVDTGVRQPHVGVIHVPDPRLDALADTEGSPKRTPPELEFVDMIATSRDAHGDPESFAKWIRDADAFVVVVGGLAADAEQSLSDLDTVVADLILLDLVSVESRVERVENEAARGKKGLEGELRRLAALRGVLERGVAVRSSPEAQEVAATFQGFRFLSAGPIVAAFNRPTHAGAELDPVFVSGAERRGYPTLCLDAALERDLRELDEPDRAEFLAAEGLQEPAGPRVIRACYDVLHVVTFYTVGDRETRAVCVTAGTTALEGAGKIHTDIQKGFVRAEVVDFRSFVDGGSWAAAKAAARFRLEGRDYVIRDGDVVHFRFTT